VYLRPAQTGFASSSCAGQETCRTLDALESHQILLEANDTNQGMAEQATTCLADHADILEEYFGIRMETQDNQVLLTGLPILLGGHAPEPHGLAIFLLRLATQVEWTEEKPCFQGVCRELGHYYALLPTMNGELEKYVRHTLFPAPSPICFFRRNVSRLTAPSPS